MNLKEYLFYKNLSPNDLAKSLHMHPNYVNSLLRGNSPLSKKFSYAIEIFTKGIVKHDNVFGPPSYPNIDEILQQK